MWDHRPKGIRGLARLVAALALALAGGVGPVSSSAPASPNPRQEAEGATISTAQLSGIRASASRIVGELGSLDASTRRRVLSQYVLNAFAVAADIPGADTEQLTTVQRAQADRLINQLLGGGPSPSPSPAPRPAPPPAPSPRPAPTPSPSPTPSPTPMPVSVVIVQPTPVSYVYFYPTQPVVLVPSQVVSPGPSLFHPFRGRSHFGMQPASSPTYLLVPR